MIQRKPCRHLPRIRPCRNPHPGEVLLRPAASQPYPWAT